MCGLGLMLVAFGLLLAPAAYHRIVEEGEDTNRLHRFSSRVMSYALLPFALALGMDIYVSMEQTTAQSLALAAGLFATVVALFFWYGLEFIRKGRREPEIREKRAMDEKENEQDEAQGTELTDKIKHVLTEARVVLPGAQALLGFQFVTTLMEAFEKLPLSLRYVHLASLMMVALSIVLLITPAAYHRIVEKGEETEHFHRFASRILIAAMIPLALGVTGDFFVVVNKITQSTTAAIISAALALLFFYGFWFGLTLYRRSRQQSTPALANGRSQQTAS
ncbi:MAG: hypothetical protein ICV68_13480 [Pyrinomonadaceae bacterium]|nr:hypothetical protein [Pyrinomonadaceae bacterium]